MAGGVADGIFVRVGTHAANLKKSIDEIRASAAAAVAIRPSVRLGAVFQHRARRDRARALAMGRSMAAGY